MASKISAIREFCLVEYLEFLHVRRWAVAHVAMSAMVSILLLAAIAVLLSSLRRINNHPPS